MFNKKSSNTKGKQSKGGTLPKGFFNKKEGSEKKFDSSKPKTFDKPFDKFNKKFDKKDGKFSKKPFEKREFNASGAIQKILGKEVVTRLRITNPKFINFRNLELTDYVNPSTGRYIGIGDRVAKCMWQLDKIVIRKDDDTGVLEYKLKGRKGTFEHNGILYAVQTIMVTDENGKKGMRVAINGFETYNLMKNFEYVDLVPSFRSPKDIPHDLGTVNITRIKKEEEKEVKERRFEFRITDNQLEKLRAKCIELGMQNMSDVLRKLISDMDIK